MRTNIILPEEPADSYRTLNSHVSDASEDVPRLYDGKFTVPVNATSCPSAFDGIHGS